MTLEQLKQTIDGLTAEEQLFAAAYIKAQRMTADTGWREEMRRRKAAVAEREGLSSESLKQLHQCLVDRGL